METYEKFIMEHSEVEAWLKNRPLNTRRQFASRLMHFSEDLGMQPEEWRKLDKFEARDIVWKYVQPFLGERQSVAVSILKSLKSWYRNLNGEKLPFDSGRGGKHYLQTRRKKLAKEHIPSKTEMYSIIDMTGNLRDRTVLMFLFHSGVRVNVIEHITFGDIADQLDQDTITLKITGDLDHKLRGYDIPFYYTFLTGEAVTTLREYCKHWHKRAIRDRPLFPTSGKKAVSQKWVWVFVKNCVEKAGFDRDSMTTHTIRKSFRKIVRRAEIKDDDDKEQLMGHKLKGSREAYYDKKDTPLILEAYQKCNFSRKVYDTEISELRKQVMFLEENGRRKEKEIQDLRVQASENIDLKQRIQKTEKKLEGLEKLIREALSQI